MMDLSSTTLISCIMPTYNRRAFVPRAIAYFLRQDYPNKELLIVDDGDDPVADLVPDDPQVRYVRLEGKRTLGAKRNLCVEAAHGDLIMHWDDDDWYAPHRISYQVEALLQAGAEVCGLRCMLFYELVTDRSWLHEYPAHQRLWLAGGSLLYTRNFWQRSPFPRIQIGEDTRFVWSHRSEHAVILPDYTFYVAMIHPQNTSPKHMRGAYWSRWEGDIRHILGADIDYYRTPPEQLERSGGCHMKLNLGCCDALLDGFVNVDVVPAPGVEVVDLRQTWPWPDSSVEHVRAHDIIEHLPDKILTMNELWRVLQPDGTAEIAVPTTDGTGAFQDPTHVSFWNRRSFLYYEAGNPYRERFAQQYGIHARFRTVREHTHRSQDGPRLTIVLQAVKP